ncbi:MAG TPA: Ig-like domain-containing protein [Candidatus Acidoferrum sp.]|nr:Ig-like domain-containing protein [Candidatus Acidoferrum sp.]
MKGWIKQLAGTLLVLLFAAGAIGLALVLRSQQDGLGATMAAAHIRAVTPTDGSTNVPTTGEIRAEYISRPTQDPAIKVEPPPGSTLGPGHWDGSTFVTPYSGLRADSLYHVELDQDDSSQKGEHRQIKVRWSFRTGAPHPTPTASARPSATVAVSATPTPGTASGPLIWYQGQYPTAYGVDWNGTQAKATAIHSQTIQQSPDGSRLWQKPATIVDGDGQPVGSVAADQSMMWADDGQQLCGIVLHPTGVYDLDLLTFDGNRHRVGSITPQGQMSAQQTPSLVACSTLTGRAVVVGSQGGYIWSLQMISLTDGTVIYERPYPNPVARVVASHDGRYIAEQLPYGSSPTQIRELPGGNGVGQLSGVIVQAFSWDGSLVAGGTASVPGTANTDSRAMVIHWQTQQTVWSLCTCPSLNHVSVLAQPNGSKLAIIAAWNSNRDWTFTIVDANGAATSVALAKTPATPAF